jgi:hypothetical protein
VRVSQSVANLELTSLNSYIHVLWSASSRRATVKVSARQEATLELDEGVEGGTDYSGILAVLGYAAAHFNKIHVDRNLLLKALALYTLVNAAVNLITRKGFGEKVGRLLCLAVLLCHCTSHLFLSCKLNLSWQVACVCDILYVCVPDLLL